MAQNPKQNLKRIVLVFKGIKSRYGGTPGVWRNEIPNIGSTYLTGLCTVGVSRWPSKRKQDRKAQLPSEVPG